MTIGFIETDDRRGAVRLDQVEGVGPEEPGNWGGTVRRVRFASGNGAPCFTSAVPGLGLLARAAQLIPAQPGISLIAAHGCSLIRGASSRPFVTRTPVIAWALCLDGEIRLVTPQGVNDGRSFLEVGPYVEMSDGSIEAADEHCDPAGFRGVEDMLDYFVNEARERDVRQGDAAFPWWNEREQRLLETLRAMEALGSEFEDADLDRAGNDISEALPDYLEVVAPTARHASRRLTLLSDHDLIGRTDVTAKLPQFLAELRKLVEDMA